MQDPDDPWYDWDPFGEADYGYVPPRSRHYASSNKVSSKKANELSQELVEIKDKIKKLQVKEKEIKRTLIKEIPAFHWVDIDGKWIVANERFSQSAKFNRTKVLYFLKKKFGANVSKAVASEFRPLKASYQTIFVKKNYLKKDKDTFNADETSHKDDIPF